VFKQQVIVDSIIFVPGCYI